MMTFRGSAPVRIWAVALGSATVLSYFGVPILAAYLTHTYAWVPDGVALGGLLGALIGLGSIFLVGGIATMGQRFERDPTDFRGQK